MNRTLTTLSKPVQIFLWSALTLYVVALPIPHTIALRNIAFLSMLLVTVFALIRCRIRPEFPLALPWAAYATVAFISVLYAVDREYSWRNFVAEIGYGALVLMFAATWSRGKPMLNGLLAIIVMLNALTILLLLVLYPYREFWDVFGSKSSLTPLASVGVNPNFLISAMPLVGLAGWKLWQSGRRMPATAMVVLWLADLGALLLNGSRQNLVAIAASVLIAAAFLPRSTFTRKRIALLMALVAIIACLFLLQLERRAPAETNASTPLVISTVKSDIRWDLWKFSVEKIIEHPWQGGGFGRGVFDRLYADYKSEDTLLWHAHNMILNKGVQMGIPGMVVFAWLWLALFRKLMVKAKSHSSINEVAITGLAIAVGVFMKSMTDDFFFRDPALLFWLLMGTLLGEIRRQEINAP